MPFFLERLVCAVVSVSLRLFLASYVLDPFLGDCARWAWIFRVGRGLSLLSRFLPSEVGDLFPPFLFAPRAMRWWGGFGISFFFRLLLTAPSRVRQFVVRTSGCASARPAGRVEGAPGYLHGRELAALEPGFFFRFPAFPFSDYSSRALPVRAPYWLRCAGGLVF